MDSFEPHDAAGDRNADDQSEPDLTEEQAARRRRSKRTIYGWSAFVCFFVVLLFTAFAAGSVQNLLSFVGIDTRGRFGFVLPLMAIAGGIALFFRPLVYLFWRFSAIKPENAPVGKRSYWVPITKEDINLADMDVRRRVLLPFAMLAGLGVFFTVTTVKIAESYEREAAALIDEVNRQAAAGNYEEMSSSMCDPADITTEQLESIFAGFSTFDQGAVKSITDTAYAHYESDGGHDFSYVLRGPVADVCLTWVRRIGPHEELEAGSFPESWEDAPGYRIAMENAR